MRSDQPDSGSDRDAQQQREPVLAAIPVTDLPPPHNLFRCTHHARLVKISDRLAKGGSLTREQAAEAGRQFWESLSPHDVRSCARHQVDWPAIVRESVRILRELGEGREAAVYLEAAYATQLPERDAPWLRSLFERPIEINSAGEYWDGQHRACGARFSGASEVVVAGFAAAE
ncbi:MAG: hypothetical protein J2P45_31280 [Candidatus Dormibacteraeota bacterium]|nr:hypothetical protein [Candidatus Dormibacteraeota bacterium]